MTGYEDEWQVKVGYGLMWKVSCMRKSVPGGYFTNVEFRNNLKKLLWVFVLWKMSVSYTKCENFSPNGTKNRICWHFGPPFWDCPLQIWENLMNLWCYQMWTQKMWELEIFSRSHRLWNTLQNIPYRGNETDESSAFRTVYKNRKSTSTVSLLRFSSVWFLLE